jgi:hypothetical protein
MKAKQNCRQMLMLTGMVVVWLALTGCPGLLNNYYIFNYLPNLKGNAWTFGCVGGTPDNSLAGIRQEVSISDVTSVEGRTVWVLSQKNNPDDPESASYAADTCYVLENDILYSTGSLEAVADLPDSLEKAFKAFIHADLTPRIIEDTSDPVRIRYGATIRYREGSLESFLPITFTRPGSENKEPSTGTVDLDAFAADARTLKDCIAMEMDVAGEWKPVMIFGRDVGPLLVQDGLGGYATLNSASLFCRKL